MRKGYAQREYTKRIKIPNAEYCPKCGLLMESVFEFNPFPMKTRKCNRCASQTNQNTKDIKEIKE